MTKIHYDLHAADARRALDAYLSNAAKDFEQNVADLIADIGHLCIAEQIDFLAVVKGGIRRWATERVNPTGADPGPTVEVTITVRDLASPLKSKKRVEKRKKSRRPRDGPNGA